MKTPKGYKTLNITMPIDVFNRKAALGEVLWEEVILVGLEDLEEIKAGKEKEPLTEGGE